MAVVCVGRWAHTVADPPYTGVKQSNNSAFFFSSISDDADDYNTGYMLQTPPRHTVRASVENVVGAGAGVGAG